MKPALYLIVALCGLQAAQACIVEPTTLALLPGLLGMPMFYANYGELSGLRYGPVLTSYPRGLPLRDIRGLASLLEQARSAFDPRQAREWIKRNAGPTPVEEMPERVAAVVQALAPMRDGDPAAG